MIAHLFVTILIGLFLKLRDKLLALYMYQVIHNNQTSDKKSIHNLLSKVKHIYKSLSISSNTNQSGFVVVFRILVYIISSLIHSISFIDSNPIDEIISFILLIVIFYYY